MGSVNFETLAVWAEQTGMCLDEAVDYLDDLCGGQHENDSAWHKSEFQNLIEKINLRVAEAMLLKRTGGEAYFLWKIGRWDWPCMSVERKFYENLFKCMEQN